MLSVSDGVDGGAAGPDVATGLGASGGSSLLTINCWFAPAAINCADIVITFGEVLLLEKRSVSATMPVKKAVAIWASTRPVPKASLMLTNISHKLLADGSCQLICPKLGAAS